jgi:membrane associated rhomboid family serine protease
MLGFCSGAVAMRVQGYGHASGRRPRAYDYRSVSDAAKILLALVALMWAVEVVDVIADHQLDQYGIEAREPQGLDGIVTAPFLHVGFGHLISNTIPFVIMGLLIAIEGARRLLAVFAIVALVSGLGTWIVAPEGSIHVGASGVVFGFATYLIARGWFNRRTGQIAIGLVILVIWGGVLVGGLQPREGISWQGHLFGAIGGVVAARVLAGGDRKRPAAPA